MDIIRLISRYDALNTMGLMFSSIVVTCCCDELRLSSDNVKSTSSRKRTFSEDFPIRIRDMPKRLIERAMIL
jgi:hypothetical protein